MIPPSVSTLTIALLLCGSTLAGEIQLLSSFKHHRELAQYPLTEQGMTSPDEEGKFTQWMEVNAAGVPVRIVEEAICRAPSKQPHLLKSHAAVADQLIVKLRRGHSVQALHSLLNHHQTRIGKSIAPQTFLLHFSEHTWQNYCALKEKLEAHHAVAHVDSNDIGWSAEGEDYDNWTIHPYQWGMFRVGFPQAWAMAPFEIGEEVIVAVIDTGVQLNHPNLKDNLWKNSGESAIDNGIDDDGNGYVDDRQGWDFKNEDRFPLDHDGHGTKAAGVIASDGTQGIVFGVAPRAQIMPLRIGSKGDESWILLSDSIEAIHYAIAQGADILNCSYGFLSDNQSARDAYLAAGEAGLFVAAAAMNEGNNLDLDIASENFYPAEYARDMDHLCAVMAIDSAGQPRSWSNYGKNTVDIAAPGGAILTTDIDSTFGYFEGTSSATPFVAGMAALIKGLRPKKDGAYIKKIFHASAVSKAPLQNHNLTSGELHAANTLASAQFYFPKTNYSVKENEPHVTITVRRASTLKNASVDYKVGALQSGQTATNNLDYQGPAGTLHFSPGQAERTIIIPILDDDIPEGSEWVEIYLSNPQPSLTFVDIPQGEDRARLTIYDAGEDTIRFQSWLFSAAEKDQWATITLVREGTGEGAAAVQVETKPIPPTPGLTAATQGYQNNPPGDYLYTYKEVIWENGEVGEKSISVPVSLDIAKEPWEYFQVTAGGTYGASLDWPSNAIVAIQDTPTQGQVSFKQSTYTVDADAPYVTLEVVRGNILLGNLPGSVVYETINDTANAGQDYVYSSKSIYWSGLEQGEELTKSINIQLLPPPMWPESTESFKVKLIESNQFELGPITEAKVVIKGIDVLGP